VTLDKLLQGVQVIAIICNQWGDTGKGKFSDYFASQWADVIARGTGGNNAGHTVVKEGKTKVFQSLPAGIAYDHLGKINILGNGMVLDLDMLSGELHDLEKDGISFQNLMISKDAHVIMPYHIARDKVQNQSQENGGIGSTGKGIGPCYTDKIARRGIQVSDLFDTDILASKIRLATTFYPEQRLDVDEMMCQMAPLAAEIKPLVRDTVAEIQEFVSQGKKVLLEGAQGLLLSIEHGTYPYVTSSDPSLNGTASGVGLSARAIDLPLGIFKFPFMTRVGGGPFPTELGSTLSEEHCGDAAVTKAVELKKYRIPHVRKNGHIHYDAQHPRIRQLMNSADPFEQGVGIRLAAAEYGAVTGRPRRIGWTDAVAAKYAIKLNSTSKILLTKTDAIAGADSFQICYGYRQGSMARSTFDKDPALLRAVLPAYKQYHGYQDITAVRDDGQLPPSLRQAIGDFERFTESSAVMVSVGPEADQTIVRDRPGR
jgi:adenylosuccinate synthase